MKTIGRILSTLATFALGGLIGAGIALLVAPQSGRATRARLYSEGVTLREKAAEEVAVTRSRLKHELNGLSSGVRIRATELGDRLQEVANHPQAAFNKALGGVAVRSNGH